MILHKTFKYRLVPTKTQVFAMVGVLDRCRELYNSGLEERREAYRMCGKSITYYDQSAQVKDIRQIRPEYADLDYQMVREPLQRLDKAFKAFFRRVKAGQKAGSGFPSIH